jgi:hypothetical protein
MSWFKRILMILAASILLPVAGLFSLDLYVRVQVALFYKAHPMLRTMNEAPPLTTRGDDSWPQMRVVLLERVPIGSARSEAVRILADEGMVCTAINTPTRNSLACSLPDDPVGVPRWHVEVNFDEHDKVAEGRVLPLKGRLL